MCLSLMGRIGRGKQEKNGAANISLRSTKRIRTSPHTRAHRPVKDTGCSRGFSGTDDAPCHPVRPPGDMARRGGRLEKEGAGVWASLPPRAKRREPADEATKGCGREFSTPQPVVWATGVGGGGTVHVECTIRRLLHK